MDRYECHITVPKPKSISEARMLFSLAQANDMKTSWITGDPVLGNGKWFYLNGYNSSFDVLLEKMKKTVSHLKVYGIEIVREKIEKIMYDTKTGHFVCGANCTACL